MKKRSFWHTLRMIFRDPVLKDISLYATSGSYYLFLSLAPLFVLVLAIIPYTPLTKEMILGVFQEFAPSAFMEILNTIVNQLYSVSFATLGVSILVVLWSAGKFFASLLRGIGEIYNGNRFMSFLQRRIFGIIFTVALILIILASMLVTMFGKGLLTLAQDYIPELERPISLILQLHWPVVLVAMTLINALLFRYIPKSNARFIAHLPGAFLVSLGWLGFSKLFSLIVERFNLFSLYGTLAAVVLSMFWIFCCLYILFLGAWLNTWRIRLWPKSNKNSVKN